MEYSAYFCSIFGAVQPRNSPSWSGDVVGRTTSSVPFSSNADLMLCGVVSAIARLMACPSFIRNGKGSIKSCACFYWIEKENMLFVGRCGVYTLICLFVGWF